MITPARLKPRTKLGTIAVIHQESAYKNTDNKGETAETVTISRAEYLRLERDSQWLACLEMAGVDNWAGIEEAMIMFTEIMKEDEE